MGELVDRHGHPGVGGPVGVDVVADHQRPGLVLQPALDRRDLAEQVDPGDLLQWIMGADRNGNDQRPGTRASQRQHASPDLRAVEVDGCDPGTPPHQRGQRPHLGAGAEHRDGVPVQSKPVGVGQHLLDRLGDRRLDHAGLDPGVHAPPYLVAAQSVTVVGQHQLAQRLTLSLDLDALELPVTLGPGLEPELTRTLEHPHPPTQGVQAALGHGYRSLARAEPGLDQPPEVHEVVGAPRRRLLGRARSGRVSRPKSVCDHSAPHRRRTAPSLVVRREDQTLLLFAAHPPIVLQPWPSSDGSLVARA